MLELAASIMRRNVSMHQAPATVPFNSTKAIYLNVVSGHDLIAACESLGLVSSLQVGS